MKRILGLGLLLILLVGCGGRSGGRSSGENMQSKQETILKSPVLINEIKRQDLKEFVTVSGTLSGIVDVTMMSETSGTILEIYKSLGEYVEKGEEIALLDNDHIRIQFEQAQASVLASEANLATANSSFNASAQLFKDGSISKMEYDNAVATLKQAQAGLAGAEANLEASKLSFEKSRLTAPVSGYIASTELEVGNNVSQGTKLLTIIDYTKLKLKTGVNESELFSLKKGQAVTIKSELSNQTLKGIITGIGMKPLANSSTYPIEIEANNPKGKFAPGMVVVGEILSKTYRNLIFTSLNHVLDDYGKKFVYVIDAENKAEKRVVELGSIIDENVIIKSGLNEGDRLVTEGMEMLNEGSPVEIKG